MNDQADTDLLAGIRSGDERAFASLLERWDLAVRAIALRYLESSAEAEDVVEEVFWQIWSQADRFDASRGSAGAWIRTIARSRALDRRKALVRAGEVALPDDDGPAAGLLAADDDAVDFVELAERVERVRLAVEELPGDQRQALQLAYYDGLSQTEIAERTGAPLGTVKTRIRLGVQKLRESLSVLGDVTA